MNWVVLLINGINLAGSIWVKVAQVKATLETLRNLDPDVQVSIKNLAGETLAVNADTIADVDAWLAAHGS